MATILRLPPDQGGLSFGPFDGIVQLGSDPRRTQIQLDARHGIYPLHATLALSPNGPHQFAPAELDAKCFVAQQGSAQVWPVQGVVQVNTGDSLILGTPGGPRFLLVEAGASVHPNPVAAAGAGAGAMAVLNRLTQRPSHRRSGNLGQDIANEFLRRGQMQLFRNGPFREVAYLLRRYRTGALFSPVTIVGGLITLFGMLGAGAMSCFGGLVGLWAQFS